jgi:hypothetical protein
MPISTNSFFAVVESTDSTAFANKDASISSCTEFDEKYGRRCVSINEMNIQNASSSGDCSRSCPAINANPTPQNQSNQTRHATPRTSGILDIRHHSQIRLQERHQRSIRLRKPLITHKTLLRVALNIRVRRYTFALPKLPIYPLDTLGLTIRQVRPHLISDRCGYTLDQQLAYLLIFARERRGRRCHCRDPF